MKQSSIAAVLASMLVAVYTGHASAGLWWKHIAPVIVSPAPNSHFNRNQLVTHCWELVPHVSADSVAYFELMYANAPPNTIFLFDSC